MKASNPLVRYYSFIYGGNPINYIQFVFGLLLGIVISPTYLLPDKVYSKLYLGILYKFPIGENEKYVVTLADRIITIVSIIALSILYYAIYILTNFTIASVTFIISTLSWDNFYMCKHVLKKPFLKLYNLFNINYKN